MDSNPKKELYEHPELRLVWPGLIGCGIGTLIGSWIYPDIGSIIGAILGILFGILIAEIIADEDHEEISQTYLDDPNAIISLDITQEAHAFFGDMSQKETIDAGNVHLPSTEKKVANNASHDREYTLRIFEQAVTSRKTGVFPHRRKK